MRINVIPGLSGNPSDVWFDGQEVWFDGIPIRPNDERVLLVADDVIGEIRFCKRLKEWGDGHWLSCAIWAVLQAQAFGSPILSLSRGRVWIRTPAPAFEPRL